MFYSKAQKYFRQLASYIKYQRELNTWQLFAANKILDSNVLPTSCQLFGEMKSCFNMLVSQCTKPILSRNGFLCLLWNSLTELSCTEPWPQVCPTHLGWTGMQTVSQVLSPPISAWVYQLSCGRIEANPCSQVSRVLWKVFKESGGSILMAMVWSEARFSEVYIMKRKEWKRCFCFS